MLPLDPRSREVLDQGLLEKARATDPRLAAGARSRLLELLALEAPLSLRAAAAQTLLDVDPQAVATIGRRVAQAPTRLRLRWLEGIAESRHPRGCELFRAYLSDRSAELRALCALGLGRCGAGASAAALAERLGMEDSARVLRQLAIALGAIANPALAPQIRPLLRSEATAVRFAAAAALGRMRDAESLRLLTELLLQGDSEHSYAAAETLGELRMTDAIAPLADALASNPNPAVRRRAAYALGRIGGPDITEPLAQALADSNPAVRSRAAYSLGSAGAAAAATALRHALNDPVVTVRHRAADALARLDAPGTAGLLAALLDDSDPEIRQRAAWGLGRRGDRRALDPLREMLATAEERARIWAVEGLRGLGALAELRTALADRAAAVRRHALEALGREGLTRAELFEALNDADSGVVEAACGLLFARSRI